MAIEVHPTAMVDKAAQLGEGVKIGPYATIGANVKLGAGTTVGQGAIEIFGPVCRDLGCNNTGIETIKGIHSAGVKQLCGFFVHNRCNHRNKPEQSQSFNH